jgi:hypothetical protein
MLPASGLCGTAATLSLKKNAGRGLTPHAYDYGVLPALNIFSKIFPENP